jgi:ATP-dependent RNA helicase DeaD
MHHVKNPAPEELFDTPLDPEQKKRDYFEGGVWFSLSIGHKHNAEPRWIVPMLCRAGHITKRDIGAIKIKETETYVELAPECVTQILESIGPSQKIEKTVTMLPMDGPPDRSQDKPHAVAEHNYAKKRAFKPKKPSRNATTKNENRKPKQDELKIEGRAKTQIDDEPRYRVVKKGKRRDWNEKTGKKPEIRAKDKKTHRGKSPNPKPKKNKSAKGGLSPLMRKRTAD